jgi:DNA-binding NtrC family response regulator
MARLCTLPWEGNARELENAIERAIAFSESDNLTGDDFPESGESTEHGENQGPAALLDEAAAGDLTLSELSERYTSQVLKQTKGNKARAAKILGINRRTLYRRGFGSDDNGEPSQTENL